MNNLSKIRIFLILIIHFNFYSCDKEDETMPYVPVNLMINITAELADLGVLESQVFDHVGLNGVIIFRENVNEYKAYENTCTFKPREQNCGLEFNEENSLELICPCCDSEFNLALEAVPTKNPAKRPLKEYSVTINNSIMFVTN